MPQNESLRLVDFTAGGRPFGVLDLESSDFSKLKGTMAVRPGQRTVSYARQPGRYGGQRATGAREENAELAWTCAVLGVTSEDQALVKAGDLLAKLADMSAGRMVEFRPRGATYPTFLDIRGPGVANPVYDADLLDQQNAILVELAVPVAPLGQMHQIDVDDGFEIDTKADFTFEAGSAANIVVEATGGGRLRATAGLTTDFRLIHTARGHRIPDWQVTGEWVKGAVGTAGNIVLLDLIVKWVDAANYAFVRLTDDGTTFALQARQVVAGVESSVNTTAITNPGVGATAWLRGRMEGGTLIAEYFGATQPTPMGAPTNTTSGAANAVFGATVAGNFGTQFRPQNVNTRLNRLIAEGYVRRNLTLPQKVQLEGIPGDAPALADLHLTPSGGAAAPVWALFAWAKRATTPLAGSVAPFGIIEAETGTSLSTWASAADANYRGGNGLKLTAAGAGTSAAEFVIDPATLAPDPFTLSELDIEVWARLELASTLVSPKLVLSGKPDAGTNFGSERPSSPFGSAGKLLVKPSSGTVFRPVRLGTLTVVCDPLRPVKWRFRLAGSWAAGSTGTFGVDQLLTVCAGQRAASPTGRANDNSFPKFVPSTSETTKIVRADLSGALVQPPGNPFGDHGLGGEPLELPVGAVDVLVWLSSGIPDDPSSTTFSEQEDYSASVHLAVTPRVRLLRGI